MNENSKLIQMKQKRSVRELYVETLQNYQHHWLVLACTWSFRTIRDMRAVTMKSSVLTGCDRLVIFFRGVLAILLWLPINIFAIPYVFILGGCCGQCCSAFFEPIPQLHEIIPDKLFLGTDQAARNEAVLQEYGVTVVLRYATYFNCSILS